MLAPWVWSLVTVLFLLGIKIYRPTKSSLPIILMGWSSTILIISIVLFIDVIALDSPQFNWEPLVLAIGVFGFCFSLYCKYIKLRPRKEKSNTKKSKARAC